MTDQIFFKDKAAIAELLKSHEMQQEVLDIAKQWSKDIPKDKYKVFAELGKNRWTAYIVNKTDYALNYEAKYGTLAGLLAKRDQS